MSARKHRIPVVLDTNVWVRNFKSPNKSSPNRRIIRVWLQQKRLQLIVSEEILAEYMEIFEDVLEFAPTDLEEWHETFIHDARVTMVRLARRDDQSRDPDDNVFLSTARAGKAKYLVTNDRDLLDLSEFVRRTLPFDIVAPDEFLRAVSRK